MFLRNYGLGGASCNFLAALFILHTQFLYTSQPLHVLYRKSKAILFYFSGKRVDGV